ncbi:MAG: hypothetical protein WB709_08565 [Solirubrobacteraceae bacterium]
MAYVVARPKGRFEVRESLHTPKGPRARSLAGFDVLTDEVLATAAARSTRPFDAEAVLASARRAGAPVRTGAGVTAEGVRDSSRRFVEASRRMALSMRRQPVSPAREDSGAALIDLLGFADAVARSQPPRPFEPLRFPVLSRLVESRSAVTSLS